MIKIIDTWSFTKEFNTREELNKYYYKFINSNPRFKLKTQTSYSRSSFHNNTITITKH